MSWVKKLSIICLLFFSLNSNLSANIPYYLDFKYILNQSDAGKKAQDFLKKKLKKFVKNFEYNSKDNVNFLSKNKIQGLLNK